MDDIDLPEPRRLQVSPEEKYERRRKLYRTLFVFAAAYSLIHKLFIPLTLKFTNLKDSPHAVIDPWLILPLALLLFIYRGMQFKRLRMALLMATLCYACYEAFLILGNYYTGWIQITKLLSSQPLGLGALGQLITFDRKYSRGKAFVAGSVVFTLLLSIFSFWPLRTQQLAVPQIAQVEKAKTENNEESHIELSAQSCGVQNAKLSSGSAAHSQEQLVVYKNCGLSPARIDFKMGTLRIRNESRDALNLHFAYFDPENPKLRLSWNLLVKPNSKMTSPKFHLKDKHLGILYSDSRPRAGIVALQSENTLARTWLLSRSPLKVQVLP